MKHWQIPKLELMQNVASSIPLNGPPIHWTVNIMEHVHIDLVKISMAATNNNDYEFQICCFLDHLKKCCAFSLALHLQEEQLELSRCPVLILSWFAHLTTLVTLETKSPLILIQVRASFVQANIIIQIPLWIISRCLATPGMTLIFSPAEHLPMGLSHSTSTMT